MSRQKFITKYFRYGLMAMGGRLKKKRALTGPWKVIIGVTDYCNYRCVMCREHSVAAPEINRETCADLPEEQRMFTEMERMDFDLYRRLIDDLKELGGISVNLSGKGEPLSHPRIMPMIDYALRKGLRTELTTNASLMDPEKAEFLVSGGLKGVHCSINAGSAGAYAEITGTGDQRLFGRVTENIRELSRIKKVLKRSSPKLMLSFVLTSMNYEEVLAAARLAIETGAERMSYAPVSIYYENIAFLELGIQEKKHLLALFRRVKPMLERHGVAHNVDETVRILSGDNVDRMKSVYSRQPCYVGWYFALVFANGTVLPCCQCLKRMGNLNEQGFGEIWNNPAYRQFREKTVTLPEHRSPPVGCLCSECSFDNYNLLFHKVLHPLTPLHVGDEPLGTLAMLENYIAK